MITLIISYNNLQQINNLLILIISIKKLKMYRFFLGGRRFVIILYTSEGFMTPENVK